MMKLRSLKTQTLNEKELRAINGGIRINFLGLVQHDSSREKGHRWKWAWQKKW